MFGVQIWTNRCFCKQKALSEGTNSESCRRTAPLALIRLYFLMADRGFFIQEGVVSRKNISFGTYSEPDKTGNNQSEGRWAKDNDFPVESCGDIDSN